MSPHELNALLLVAAVELDKDIEIHGEYAPSAGEEFAFSLDEGVEIWLLKVFRPQQGYLTYYQLRTMITGLQIYMVIGRRPRALRFRVLNGPNNVVLGQGAVGGLWPPDPPSNTTAKRDFQLSNTNLASSMSSNVDSNFSNLGESSASLLTSENSKSPNNGRGPYRLKVPNTEMTLALTIRSQHIDLFALEALLFGANGTIYHQIDLHGETAQITARNFRHYLAYWGVFLEVLSWQSSPNDGLTWFVLFEVFPSQLVSEPGS